MLHLNRQISGSSRRRLSETVFCATETQHMTFCLALTVMQRTCRSLIKVIIFIGKKIEDVNAQMKCRIERGFDPYLIICILHPDSLPACIIILKLYQGHSMLHMIGKSDLLIYC